MTTPKSSIAKGKALENWIVDRLRLSGLDKRAYRQKGSGNGLNKGDIWNDLNLCIEAKNTKIFPHKALKQVAREAMGYQKEVIVWHPPQTPMEASIVLIHWDYFEELLKKTKEPEMRQPDKSMKWKLENLKRSISEVLKELSE